jgi:outer membrane lipoprotein-sorting protein
MKRLWLSILFVALGLFATAQTQLSEAQSQELMVSLTEVATSMQTMQCRFVQSKTMAMLAEPSVSEGKMYFSSPDRLRWEYLTPYPFALIVNGERMVKVTDGQVEVLDGNSGRMYQGITSMIMGSASGKKLFDASAFDVVLYDDGAFWKVEMTPKRRDMKRMFSQLVFHFDKKSQVIDHVEFVEPKGDKTVIRFEEIKLNEAIEEELFQ